MCFMMSSMPSRRRTPICGCDAMRFLVSPRKESFLHSLLSSVAWRGGERLVSFAKHILIASVIGLSTQLDVYYMVVGLLGVLVFSWGNLLDVVAIPAMVACQQEEEEEAAAGKFRTLTSGIFQLTIYGSLGLTFILVVGRGLFAEIAIGFDDAQKAQVANGFLWIVPTMLLWVPMHFLQSILRAKRHFSIAYQADFIYGLVILICVLIWWRHPQVLLWGVSVATVITYLYLLSFTWRDVFPRGNPLTPEVISVLRLAPSLLLVQGAIYIFILSDRIYVSFLDVGGVSALAYASVLINLVPGIINLGGGFITVVSEIKTRKTRSQRLDEIISLSIFVSAMIGLFLLIAGEDMVAFLFQRGLFDDDATRQVSIAMVALAAMILPIFLMAALEQIFQVEKRLGIIAIRTAIGVVCNIVLNWLALFVLGWGLFGIALATTISNWAMMLASIQALRRLGYPIRLGWHIMWGLWLIWWLFLSTIFFYFLAPSGGLAHILLTAFYVGLASLLAGVLYPGRERQLIIATSGRLLSRAFAIARQGIKLIARGYKRLAKLLRR